MILTSSIVGDVVREINISLVRESGQDWGLEWSDAAILPELTPENGLTVAPLRPTRGNIYDANGEVFVTEGLQAVSMYLVPNTIGGEESEDATNLFATPTSLCPLARCPMRIMSVLKASPA